MYNVKSGNINEFAFAKNHRQAAIKIINSSNEKPDIFVIVNKNKITAETCEENVYFLTESINKKVNLVI